MDLFTPIAFDQPWYLLLLLLVPVLWVWSFRSLAGLGPMRRVVALLLRTTVFTLLVFCLAEMQYRRANERLTVIYLLDQSASIPAAQREAMVDYVVEAVRQQRKVDREDRAGVIVFGREATIEVPPFDDDLPLVGRLESLIDLKTDATNLEAALKLAQATFAEDSAKRIVIVTDGNENLGDARGVAEMLAESGIAFDVLPIRLSARADVALQRVILPSDIRKGQPFEVRVVANNTTPVDKGGRPVPGRLKLFRRTEDITAPIGDPEGIPVTLEPGKKAFSFEDVIDEPDFFTYEARFVPDDAKLDRVQQKPAVSIQPRAVNRYLLGER